MSARNAFKLLARAVRSSTQSHSKYAPALMDGFASSTEHSNGMSYQPMRSFTFSSSTLDLSSVLKEELKYEKENYQPIDVIKSGPPAPFTLVEDSGDTLMTLKRKYGEENISIDLHLNNQNEAPADDSEDTEELSAVVFNVTVVKGDKSLVFQVESDGTDISIGHISFEPKGGETSDSFYYGPVFSELDETVQAEFKEYLIIRGITADVGEYLRHLIFDKEEREYASWLSKVNDFVR